MIKVLNKTRDIVKNWRNSLIIVLLLLEGVYQFTYYNFEVNYKWL